MQQRLRGNRLRVCMALACCWLAGAASAEDELFVYVSPDGKKRVVQEKKDYSQVLNAEYRLLVETLDEGTGEWGSQNLIAYEGHNMFGQWSPDSTRIAFKADRGSGPTGSSNDDIHVIRCDGSEELNLTASYRGQDWGPSWSPDGSKIAFFSFRRNSTVTTVGVWVVGSHGGEAVRIPGSDWMWAGDIGWLGTDWVLLPHQDGVSILSRADGSGDLMRTFAPGKGPWIYQGGLVLATLTPQQTNASPLALVSLFGQNFSLTTTLWPTLDQTGKISTIAERTCVRVNGRLAPVFAVTPGQINFQIPADAPYGFVEVNPINNCGLPGLEQEAGSREFVIEEASPGLFVYPPFSDTGFIAARFSEDGAPVAPPAAVVDGENRVSRPARPGDTIEIYGTAGAPVRRRSAQENWHPPQHCCRGSLTRKSSLTGTPLAPEDIFHVGLAPGTAGLYQLNIAVPRTAAQGNHSVVLTVYGRSSPLGPVIPVAGERRADLRP